MSAYGAITEYQLRQILKGLTGKKEVLYDTQYPDIESVFEFLWQHDFVTLPCEPGKLFVIYDRFPIFNDVLCSVKKSVLLSQLFDRADETAVVVDSVRSGQAALFLAKLVPAEGARSQVQGWIEAMPEMTMQLTLQRIDNENKVIIAPFSSFVLPRVEA